MTTLQDLISQKATLDVQIAALELEATVKTLQPIYTTTLVEQGLYVVFGKINDSSSIGVLQITYRGDQMLGSGLIMSRTGERRNLFGEPLTCETVDDVLCLCRDNLHLTKLVPFTQKYWDGLVA
jgi:hypothetical protein